MFPHAVEQYYSIGLYPAIGTSLRMITRWTSFSLGDIFYCLLGVILLFRLIRLGVRVYRREMVGEDWVLIVFSIARTVLSFYIIFQLFWGLNYDRLGIAKQLNIQRDNYSKEEVTELANLLIDKLNATRAVLKDSSLPEPPLDSIYREAHISYQNISLQYEYLNYRNRSVKRSLFSALGDYMGYTGYYNPFSGEAQVRTDLPRILMPYISCHEMAHQLGYASESEASFVGYLAAAASKDPYFQYSVYLDLFSYAQSAQLMLYGKEKDFKAFEHIILQNRQRLDTLVKKDRKEIREFFNQRRKKSAPAFTSLYDQFLKFNNQLRGVESYDEIIGWLIAYQKKYGKI
ncbi:MAG: hypothetical protein RLZZ28_2374 [Bacteroidota bacterium]|jgi:hypothetical protein